MPEEGWVPVANSAARDYRLSWRARGLLTELLSYPDGWETTVDKLVADARREGDATEGRDAMASAMRELVRAGYARYARQPDKQGRWTTELEITDEYRPTSDPLVGQPGARDAGRSVNRGSDGRLVSTKTDTKTEPKTVNQRSSTEHSVSLVSLAADAGASARESETEKLLNRTYNEIDRLGQDAWRRHLLNIERRRPSIYRQCRNNAIKHINRDEPKALKGDQSAAIIDRLSYKYVAQHYIARDGEMPLWLSRPLDRERGFD